MKFKQGSEGDRKHTSSRQSLTTPQPCVHHYFHPRCNVQSTRSRRPSHSSPQSNRFFVP
ncbi:hypothetical protein WG66_015558, partial [Moniliophthora roreri]